MKNKGLMFIGIGFELVGLILSAIFLGNILDSKNHWPGYGVIASLVLALVIWFYHLIFLIKRFLKTTQDSEIE